MNLKNYLFLLVLLLAAGVRAQAPSGNAYPKREFRAAWIQAVNGQFRGIPTEKLKQTLVGQLNSLHGVCFTTRTVESFPDRNTRANAFSYVGSDAIHDRRMP